MPVLPNMPTMHNMPAMPNMPAMANMSTHSVVQSPQTQVQSPVSSFLEVNSTIQDNWVFISNNYIFI